MIVGKFGFELEILINMYKQLIEVEDEYVYVMFKFNFGKIMFLFSVLKNNQVDIYFEFIGLVLEILVKGNNLVG